MLRFAKDKWLSREHTFARKGIFAFDKFQHFFGSFLLSLLLFAILRDFSSFIITLGIGILWEIKDGILKWENEKNVINIFGWKYNIGGDGISWKDIIADGIGIICSFILIKFISLIIQ